jgi:sec-independent protein translocase protein TatC
VSHHSHDTEQDMKITKSNSVLLFAEFRARLIYSLIFLFLLFAILLYFANHLYTWLALPLLKFLPQGHLIATQIVSPFFVPFKLAFMTAIMLAMPFFLWQIWRFISPALYTSEKKLLWPFLLASVCLFYAGIAFAYFVIFPMLFHFLAGIAPVGVALSPDISEYLDFTLKLLFVFGSLFEIPIIMFLLFYTGLVSCQRFIKMRSYAIVASFILGMLFAPPDVFSQTILAIPIWLLYEIGILLIKGMRKV